MVITQFCRNRPQKLHQRRTKSTRKRNTPENAGNRPFAESFRVCCVFGCSLFPSKRAPKHTRKRNTPENADSVNGRLPAFLGVLRFRVLFGTCQLPKGPNRTKNSTESKFTTAKEKRYGNSKTIRIVLRGACLPRKKEAGNGTDSKKLRR